VLKNDMGKQLLKPGFEKGRGAAPRRGDTICGGTAGICSNHLLKFENEKPYMIELERVNSTFQQTFSMPDKLSATTAKFFGPAAKYFCATAQFCAPIAKYFGATAQFCGTTAKYFGAIDQFFAETAQFCAEIDQFFAETAQFCGAIDQFCAETAQFCGAIDQFCAETAKYFGAIDQFCAETAQFFAETDQFCAETDQLCAAPAKYFGTIDQFFASPAKFCGSIEHFCAPTEQYLGASWELSSMTRKNISTVGDRLPAIEKTSRTYKYKGKWAVRSPRPTFSETEKIAETIIDVKSKAGEAGRIGIEVVYGKESHVNPLDGIKGVAFGFRKKYDYFPCNYQKYPEPLPLPDWVFEEEPIPTVTIPEVPVDLARALGLMKTPVLQLLKDKEAIDEVWPMVYPVLRKYLLL